MEGVPVFDRTVGEGVGTGGRDRVKVYVQSPSYLILSASVFLWTVDSSLKGGSKERWGRGSEDVLNDS